MKKKLTIVALFLLLTLVLTGCACKHEWTEATCTVPKTCQKCEEVEGEALGHTWVDATCEAPKTCSVCAETEGEALGHTWVDADCVTPKTCSVCAATEGEALGHTFADADCVTPKTCTVCTATEGEALGHTFADADCVTPKTCTVCAATEGEALGHTWVDATCEAPKTCDLCAATEGEALGHTWVDATCEAPKTCSVCAATEGEALPHSIGWAVNEGKLEKKCENCAYSEQSHDLTLTSGVEMKAVTIDDAYVMPVPATWTTENVPEAFVTPASVYSCYDAENNFALVVERQDLDSELTTEEAFELLGSAYSNMELIKSESGLDVIIIRDDDKMIQLALMNGKTLNVIVLLHADESPVAGDATLDAVCVDIANNIFAY